MARRPRNANRTSQWKRTPMTLQTLQNMEARGFNFNDIRPNSGAVSYIHDLSSPTYSWLLPGWIVEERVLPHGRLYKYYYDPAGHQYKNKYEVLDQWESLGIIVLDT